MERYSYEQDESYIKRLVEYIRELEEELKKYKHYYDYEKEELADSCYDFSLENDKLKEEVKNLKDVVAETIKENDELEEENRKLKEKTEKLEKELSDVYKAYHTAMWVDYDSEEDLYTNEDIEWHNVQ